MVYQLAVPSIRSPCVQRLTRSDSFLASKSISSPASFPALLDSTIQYLTVMGLPYQESVAMIHFLFNYTLLFFHDNDMRIYIQ